MADLSFQDSFGLLVADYEKYSRKMVADNKQPVSLIKYAFGNL